MTGKFVISLIAMAQRKWGEETYIPIFTEKFGRKCNAICYMKKVIDDDKVMYYWATENQLPQPEELKKLEGLGYIMIKHG